MLAPVLSAVDGLDVTVAYTHTPRPFDTTGLRALVDTLTAPPLIVLVEPYLAGTSAHVVADALRTRPHRLLSLGVGRRDPHRYGTRADHQRFHRLDPTALRASIVESLAVSSPGE
jgi:transketolase